MARQATRKTTKRARKYVPVNLLSVPEEVEAHFRKQGFKLRWVRHMIRGNDDVKSLTTRLREGWEFVKQTDIPEHLQNDFEIGSGRVEGSIVNADVVLMKIPVELAEERNDYFVEMANRQLDATANQLQRTSSRDMPIVNESTSETTTGRKPAKIGAITEDD